MHNFLEFLVFQLKCGNNFYLRFLCRVYPVQCLKICLLQRYDKNDIVTFLPSDISLNFTKKLPNLGPLVLTEEHR